MDPEASLSQVKRLLELVPGVEMVWVRKAPSLIRLGLTVQSPSSIARLAHISLAANVLFAVEVDWGWCGDEDDPACVRYELRVPREAEPQNPPSTLEIVGIYLARYLKGSGKLAPSEADTLLRGWNTVVE